MISGEGFRPQTETEEQSYLRTWYVVQNSALGFFLSRKKTVTRTSSKSVTGNNSSSSINNVCTIVLHPGASTGNIFHISKRPQRKTVQSDTSVILEKLIQEQSTL